MARSARGPRYVVQIALGGGIDTIWSADPKTRAEVDPVVDVSYASSQIISAGAFSVGPHLRALVPHARRMAILRGVRMFTANHQTGGRQLLRMRTNASPRAPTLLDIIGRHRDTQAIASISLGQLSNESLTPNLFGGPSHVRPASGSGSNAVPRGVLEQIDALGREDLRVLSEFHAEEARRLARGGESTRYASEAHAGLDRLYRKLLDVPRFAPTWDASALDPPGQALALDFQRALWAIEHDLTRTVYILMGGWDSHQHNDAGQADATLPFAELTSRFLTDAANRSNRSGALLDQTLIIAGSELGRFPSKNAFDGKDHFPEVPVLLFGSGIGAGAGTANAFGGTDRHMAARGIDPGSGACGTEPALTIDDLGATLLAICGVSPAPYGYTGRVLPFLTRGAR
jgi:hypothetical protein